MTTKTTIIKIRVQIWVGILYSFTCRNFNTEKRSYPSTGTLTTSTFRFFINFCLIFLLQQTKIWIFCYMFDPFVYAVTRFALKIIFNIYLCSKLWFRLCSEFWFLLRVIFNTRCILMISIKNGWILNSINNLQWIVNSIDTRWIIKWNRTEARIAEIIIMAIRMLTVRNLSTTNRSLSITIFKWIFILQGRNRIFISSG